MRTPLDDACSTLFPNLMPSTQTPIAGRMRVSRDDVVAWFRAAPTSRQQQVRAGAADLLACIEAYGTRGRGLLSDVLGRSSAFEEWRHYPARDARDPDSGDRFYYHAHAARQRMPGEHGHFHIFAEAPSDRQGTQPQHVHLLGLSVNERGFPLRVFTTNQWVTAERWTPAREVLARIDRLELASAKPRAVARWVQAATQLFAPQIEAVVRLRDVRMSQRTARLGRDAALNDRRTHIVSQCPVDLARQFVCLEVAGLA